MKTFILASSSPRRRELLAGLGIAFTIIKPEIDETQRDGEAPLDYVRRLSREKAAAVATTLTIPGTVLAADTVVILGADTLGIDERGDILGKPADAADARQMLQRLRGRVHRVCTALTLLPVGNSTAALDGITRVTCTEVTMRDYRDTEIDAYIATGDPFDKAGSYAIQHETFAPVAHLEGSYSNVVGLPLETLREMLDTLGVE
jgi:septum formation protein